MVFSSAVFLFYFLPLFLVLYFLAPVRYKNSLALIGSLFFYAWGAPLFIFILLASIITDFYLVKRMAMHSGSSGRNYYLIASIGLNVALLFYFKYAGFFVDTFNDLFSAQVIPPMIWTSIALPIGISFFTFQKLSYTLDVYYRQDQPLEKLSDYALYILLFPQLIAGPIVRFKEIASQLKDRSAALTTDNKINGLFRFSIGLTKKLLIANVLGEYVDVAFANEIFELGTLDAWIIIMAYAFQIYFDFSGYSDMAIGIGLMMGFQIPENFNFPYISKSITEFWQRWHMSLSRWMKDYLYIPLGGNRRGAYRTYINLTIVFLISGLWHGAAWTFVFWGAFHGLFLVLERLFLLRWYEKLPPVFPLFFCFVIVLLGWTLFRAETIHQTFDYYQLLFSAKASTLKFSTQFCWTFGLAILISFIAIWPMLEQQLNVFYQQKKGTVIYWKIGLTFVLLLVCMSEVLVGGFNPFIYFRF